jgi:hypothetical protein
MTNHFWTEKAWQCFNFKSCKWKVGHCGWLVKNLNPTPSRFRMKWQSLSNITQGYNLQRAKQIHISQNQPGQTSPELCRLSGEHCPAPHIRSPGTNKLKDEYEFFTSENTFIQKISICFNKWKIKSKSKFEILAVKSFSRNEGRYF